MNKEEIKNILSSQLSFLKEKYHVKKLGIFGSVVRNEAKEDSDVDVMVEFESPIGFFEFIRLENFLSEKIQQKVDLVSTKAIKPIIKNDILKETIYV
ncbi:MAG: nucleotidyltransferase family protein [Candidatus Firestonebacteria bacterium]